MDDHGDHDFGILLGLAYQRFVDELRAHLASAGVTDVGGSFGYVLRALDQQPLTTSQLAARLAITSQGAAKIVDDMVASGYVERRPDPGDGRQKQLFLGARGAAVLAAARRFHRDFEQDLAGELGARRARELRAALTRIVERAPGAVDRGARLLRPL
jgi:DNA-binding MarR family transcriptional regulator